MTAAGFKFAFLRSAKLGQFANLTVLFVTTDKLPIIPVDKTCWGIKVCVVCQPPNVY
jgi:hypothetical protein